MNTNIELADRKRTRYRGGHVLWLIVFFIAWIVRSIIKIAELELDTLHGVVLAVLLISILFQAYYAFRMKSLEKEIKSDSTLKEALNNELVRLNELKAWRASFFSLIIFIVIAAILSLFVRFDDLMLIFVTALLIGFGTYNSTRYFLDR